MRQFLFAAAQSGDPVAEIIPGKGSGRLRRRVLAFLDPIPGLPPLAVGWAVRQWAPGLPKVVPGLG